MGFHLHLPQGFTASPYSIVWVAVPRGIPMCWGRSGVKRSKCERAGCYSLGNRRCDLWYHMFTKEPQSLDFLQARFIHSLMEENITSYILWRLHCLIPINFWYDERGHKTCPAFTFITLGFMWKLWHKILTYHRTSAVSCLPEYPKNAQGHTYCRQSSHGL